MTPSLLDSAPLETLPWSYAEAFSRHQGLLEPAEQERLRHARVAVAGLGGVGGAHLITLARLGIGAFRIADPDRFETVNFNRQYGACLHSLDLGKAEVMAQHALAINPDLDLRVFAEGVNPDNVAAFLDGVDVLVDGIDFFALETRRLLFREARRRGIWAVTAAPLGFSSALLTFAPDGMSFDDYFDIDDSMPRLDRLVAFYLGLAPRATHAPYMRGVDLSGGRGPSTGLACQLCSGMAAAETLKILLRRGPLRPAPAYAQFDAFTGTFRQGYLRFGNRHPWQRLRRWLWKRRWLRAAPPHEES
ncbi:MAG: ThiF family adenylyltransferase [Gemmataceae bacterium]